jgi:hypothetical protein
MSNPLFIFQPSINGQPGTSKSRAVSRNKHVRDFVAVYRYALISESTEYGDEPIHTIRK